MCAVQNARVGYTAVQLTNFDKAPHKRGVRLGAFDPTGVMQDNTVAMVGNMLVELGATIGVYDAAALHKMKPGEEVAFGGECADWWAPSRILVVCP